MAEIYSREICEKSFSEMQRFVYFANGIGEKPMLFGGWAVYYYNQYAGSRDVDFVVSDENFDSLVDFLAKAGYGQKEVRLFKDGIFFDLYKRSEDIGSEDSKIPFELLYENAECVYLKNFGKGTSRNQVMIPSRTSLLYSKITALISRSVPKDRSDIAAVLINTPFDELQELKKKLSVKQKERVLTLRNDIQSISLVTKITKKKLNDFNQKVTALL